MKPHLFLCPIAVGGTFRYEVGMLLAYATAWRFENQAKIGELSIYPIQGVVPTPCARNQAVKKAREARADILVMVDDDMAPDVRFFGAAVDFLIKHSVEGNGPAVIGAPYCCAPPEESVLAFENGSIETGCGTPVWKVHRIPREDAARRVGVEQVINIGTGFIAYDMACFDKITPPYFAYQYTDEFHTNIIETEDCYLHRRLSTNRVPLYVDWTHWAGHWKQKRVDKPVIVKKGDIDEFYFKQVAGIASAEHAQNGTVKDLFVVPNAPVAQQPNGNGQHVKEDKGSVIAVNGEPTNRIPCGV